MSVDLTLDPNRPPTALEMAILEEVRAQHAEITGNPWLEESIIAAFRYGTDALVRQNEQLMALITANAMTNVPGPFVVHDQVAFDFPAAQLRPRSDPEPVTPDRIIAALAKQPELLWAVKGAMLSARVAGPWVVFNSSEYAKAKRVSFPRGAMTRLTPSGGSTVPVPVVKVHTAIRPSAPDPEGYTEPWDYEAAQNEYEVYIAEIAAKPWKWSIDLLFHKHFPMDGREGLAETKRGAKDAADTALQAAAWALVSD